MTIYKVACLFVKHGNTPLTQDKILIILSLMLLPGMFNSAVEATIFCFKNSLFSYQHYFVFLIRLCYMCLPFFFLNPF